MGYRNYFYKISKTDYDALKDLSCEEIRKQMDEKDITFSEFFEGPVFCFGKLYWDDTAERIEREGAPFFTKKETAEEFNEYNPVVISKEGFLKTIEIYKEKIENLYKVFVKDPEKLEELNKEKKPLSEFFIELKRPEDLTEEEKTEIIENARDHAFEWINWGCEVLNLKKNRPEVVCSSLHELDIFNLVAIYKQFNFEEDLIVFLGY